MWLILAALLCLPIEWSLAIGGLLALDPRGGIARGGFWLAGATLGIAAGSLPVSLESRFDGWVRARSDRQATRGSGTIAWIEPVATASPAVTTPLLWLDPSAATLAAGDWFCVSGVVRYGDSPRNPGGRPGLATMRATTAVAPDLARGVLPPPLRWPQWLGDSLASLIDRRLATLFDPRAAALARALALGRADRLDGQLRQALRDCGAWHLIAVSGSHVVLLVAMLRPLLPRRRPRLALTLALAAVGLFVLLCGAQPPVLRAAIGFAAYQLARRFGFANGGVRILAAAFLLLIAASPTLLMDAGVQLSFAAVFALEVAGRYGPSRSPRGTGHGIDWRVPLGRACRAALFASTATAPLTALHFGSVAWLAPLATVLLTPLVTVGLATSLIATLLIWWPPFVTAPCNALLSALDSMIGSLAAALAALPATPLEVVPPSLFARLALLGFWVALFLRRTGVALLVAAALLVRSLLPATVASVMPRSTTPSTKQRATLDLLDVGHGQAILLRDAETAWLFDSGSSQWDDAAPLVNALRALEVPALDGLILSHLDADHCNLAASLMDRWPIAALYVSPQADAELRSVSHGPLADLAARARARGIPRRVVTAGQNVGVHRVVWPPSERRFSARNDASLAVVAKLAEQQVLLPGDLEGYPLLDLAHRIDDAIDLLVLPHHGNRDAGLATLLERTRARLAFASRSETELPPETVRALAERWVPWRSSARSGWLHYDASERFR